MSYIIAIDGPSGVGKGLISSSLAKRINFEYLNTGLYYRTVAYLCAKDLDNVDKLYDTLDFKIIDNQVLYNNKNITDKLKTIENTKNAAYVSNNSNLRNKINDDIRNYCKNKFIVVDGRDVGSNIFKNANIKIYLDASFDVRVKRRYLQLKKEENIEKIVENIKYRDKIDMSRENGKLIICDDAYVIDTNNKNESDIVNEIINLIGSENNEFKRFIH